MIYNPFKSFSICRTYLGSPLLHCIGFSETETIGLFKSFSKVFLKSSQKVVSSLISTGWSTHNGFTETECGDVCPADTSRGIEMNICDPRQAIEISSKNCKNVWCQAKCQKFVYKLWNWLLSCVNPIFYVSTAKKR